MSIDREAAERAVRQLLLALGHDAHGDPELADTPKRVVEAFTNDLLCGYEVDLAGLVEEGSSALAADAKQPARGIVLVRDIAVATVCPHHLLPASGKASVAYLPGKRLLGLGTLAGLVDACARRLTLQEAIGDQVVQALMQHAQARGAHCRLTLTHSCLSLRGSRQAAASVTTVAAAGELAGPEGAARVAAARGEPRE